MPNKKDGLKKIDMHSHTSGASFCSQVSPATICRFYAAKGIDSFVLTNHISPRQMYAGNRPAKDNMGKFINEFLSIREEARRMKMYCILGAEVAVASIDQSGLTSPTAEFLLYGATPEFFLRHPDLCTLTQMGLYELCFKNNILMYQAHPFRLEHGQVPQDPIYMDGVEINCHPAFVDKRDTTLDFANKYDLGVVCGSDMHMANQAGYGGIFVPENIENSVDLASYLKAEKRPKIFISPTIKIRI